MGNADRWRNHAISQVSAGKNICLVVDECNGDVPTGMRRWCSVLRPLNPAIGESKLSLSLGVRDGTGFYRFHCPGFDRRRTVGRPSQVSHPATQCLPVALAILAETEQIDDSTR